MKKDDKYICIKECFDYGFSLEDASSIGIDISNIPDWVKIKINQDVKDDILSL
jgi:hypothetical protein